VGPADSMRFPIQVFACRGLKTDWYWFRQMFQSSHGEGGSPIDLVLSRAEWKLRQHAHSERLGAFIDAHLRRASVHDRHPVYDFLFSYYSFRPAHLMRWSPGFGVALADAGEDEFPEIYGFRGQVGACRYLDVRQFPEHRIPFVRWALHYLREVETRPPRFSCFGLHEWAMLYRAPQVRHTTVPMRVTPEEIESVINEHRLSCSHFDAYRFFTAAATPRNQFHLTRDAAGSFDQPGCIHVAMDLYKFSYKVAPWVSGELISDAFFLARDCRILDMEASPYDIRGLGFGVVPIETEAGRLEYVARQRELSVRSQILRRRLIGSIGSLAKSLAA
jgi:hypothetical protein